MQTPKTKVLNINNLHDRICIQCYYESGFTVQQKYKQFHLNITHSTSNQLLTDLERYCQSARRTQNLATSMIARNLINNPD